jgi:hypothetical protein
MMTSYVRYKSLEVEEFIMCSGELLRLLSLNKCTCNV